MHDAGSLGCVRGGGERHHFVLGGHGGIVPADPNEDRGAFEQCAALAMDDASPGSSPGGQDGQPPVSIVRMEANELDLVSCPCLLLSVVVCLALLSLPVPVPLSDV